LLNFLRRLFCRHVYHDFVRNIYGDEIGMRNGCRSEWRCRKCGLAIYHRYADECSLAAGIVDLLNRPEDACMPEPASGDTGRHDGAGEQWRMLARMEWNSAARNIARKIGEGK